MTAKKLLLVLIILASLTLKQKVLVRMISLKTKEQLLSHHAFMNTVCTYDKCVLYYFAKIQSPIARQNKGTALL